MTEGSGEPVEDGRPAVQAVAAIAAVAALCGGLWWVSSGDGASRPQGLSKPAACESEKPGRTHGAADAKVVSGAQLCTALNRPDLAELLGTPGQIAKSASGGDGSMKLLGTDIATPSAQVQFETYTVALAATYDRLPVAGSAVHLGSGAQPRTVLDRPAVLYSSHTISIRFRVDGTDSSTGPGVPTRVLSVAQDAKDSGGSFEVTLFREDGTVPDEAVLLRVAEKVLPSVPRWAANG
ncbi:DUF6215 domain-containing protein [Streptomyces sp. NPDC006632]|uniref:DUF6215 domain-containing protein n=1 Tax=Streptomyces sp. NPDC006632 TaxID=3157182 RepID=UPI0033B599F6